MKIVIIVPDGVGVKNYLYSSFTNHLQDKNIEIVVFHKLTQQAVNEIKKNKTQISKFYEIPSFIETPLIRFLRETLAYARLLRNEKVLKNKTILKFWSPGKKGIKKKLLYFFSEVIGFVFSKSYSFILYGDKIFEKKVKKTRSTDLFIKKLKEIKPNLVLNLHQRAPLASPIISAAKELDIKTATVIFSWDNVPKARLINRYDVYFAWSKIMKDQLSLLYPEIDKNKIKVTGSPQFEFYFEGKYKLTKEVFFNKYNLDIKKKTICFSGDDEMTSPFDHIYFRDLCESVAKFSEKDRPQIIFRRCPVDFSNRYDDTLEKYSSFVVQIKPDWNIDKNSNNSFSLIYPAYNDIGILVNTCLHSDLVINLGSTMAHDFAVYNKPCLYLNYNPVKENNWNVDDIYKFEHFKSMDGLNAVGWVNNKKDFFEKILQALNKPELVGNDRLVWLKKIIKNPIEENSLELVAKILEEF
jgi:hypothetical protein